MERHGYLLGGQVQGVGFRPFVHRTARRLGLTGFVGNTSQGVVVEVQGETAALAAFAQALATELPPLARITEQCRRNLPLDHGETSFRIAVSEGRGGHTVLVSPDVATCDACLADLRDPAGRRYGYAFTNCTDCGPRYTITRSIPYDRAATTMSCFPLCPECRAEYEDPANRRFHAQPNACPVCGPRLRLFGGGRDGAGTSGAGPDTDAGCLRQAAEALAQGRIVAVKGLGGFLLACDARNEGAVAELRRRKRRPHKSLGVMVADIGAARRIARLTSDEAAALLGPERPVVVALRRLPPSAPDQRERTGRGADDGGDPLPAIVAPDLDSVGIMLPYTPLHHLLLEAFGRTKAGAGRAAALIMTSGNAGGEPISLGNREALARLAGIADLFLAHNRDILIRADDSVVRLIRPLPEADCAPAAPQRQFLRRARGFVPRPVELTALPGGEAPCILAAGGELKNALCLTRGRQAFVSQHIGDLKNPETLAFFRETAAHFAGLLEVEPAAVVRDLHPDYLSSSFAEEYGREHGVPVLRMQHHFAHVYGVLAEHRHPGPSLGLALDGTGFGEDGTIWGGELLFVRPEGVCRSAPSPGRRLGRLAPFPLPGGEMAIREPWRLVSAFLGLCDEKDFPAAGDALLPSGRRNGHAAIVEMVRRDRARRARGEAGFLPWTSSCGRLFDAVSSLLGLCDVISYEGQAAIRLEQAQDRRPVAAGTGTADGEGALPVRLGETADGLLELDTLTLFLHLLKWRIEGRPAGELARRFHLGLVEGLAEMAAAASRRTGVTTVALSGGVLHNVTIARHLPAALRRRGLLPLVHLELPPGDGGLCLGQADWARRALRD